MLAIFCLCTYFYHFITTVSEHFTTVFKYHYSSCVKYDCIYPLSTAGKLRHEDVWALCCYMFHKNFYMLWKIIIILYLCPLKYCTKFLWDHININFYFYSPNFHFQAWTSLIVFPACVLKDFKIFCFYVLSVCVFGCNFNSLILNHVGHPWGKLHEIVMPLMNELQSYEYQIFLVKEGKYWIRHNSELG